MNPGLILGLAIPAAFIWLGLWFYIMDRLASTSPLSFVLCGVGVSSPIWISLIVVGLK